MIQEPQCVKHFASAKRRFLTDTIDHFLQQQCPRMLGALLSRKLAEKLTDLINLQLPPSSHLRPGQMVWNAISKDTRPDSKNRKIVPVILTLVKPEDIDALAKGTPMSHIAQNAIARILREAHQQGGLLTMRDIGLFSWRQNSQITSFRQRWEKDNGQTLPHPGSLQDFGTCVTHKAVIVRKAVLEQKDPRTVAAETKHSQRAVDNYISDFHRVETAYKHNKDIGFIAQVTGMSTHLVKEYVEILQEIEKKCLTGNMA